MSSQKGVREKETWRSYREHDVDEIWREKERERVEGVFYFHGKTVLRATCITFRTSHIREGLNVRLT